MFPRLRSWFIATACLLSLCAHTGELRHPEIDALNVRVGTQTFGVQYQFTTNTALVETALAIREMESDILKLYLGKGLPGQYGIAIPAYVSNLVSLAKYEPSCRRVLDLPFQHVLAWTYAFSATSDTWWKDGYTPAERQKEFAEIYDLTRYLLTNYNNTGKHFYLGHWEGDWYLLSNYNTAQNPTPTAIQGMVDWLNTRQAAVDTAVRTTPHTNVAVYHYTEVNRVRDAMVGGSTNGQRLVNAVLPLVTNIDLVSWSAYDGMNLSAADLVATLDYIQSMTPSNKAGIFPGKRVFIGEYGWGGTHSGVEQEPLTRRFMQQTLAWGAPLVLFWQMYNNEPNQQYWLIDTNNFKVPCWFLHQRFANATRLKAARFLETHGRVPNVQELNHLLLPLLDQPLTAPVPITITDQAVVTATATSAVLRATLSQHVYGDEDATLLVAYGLTDGGTSLAAWDKHLEVGVNQRFNPSDFSITLTNLLPLKNYHYRFFATNKTAPVWVPASSQLYTRRSPP